MDLTEHKKPLCLTQWLKRAAGRVRAAVQAGEHELEMMQSNPSLPQLPNAVAIPHKIVAQLDDKIFKRVGGDGVVNSEQLDDALLGMIDQNQLPMPIKQKDMSRTLDYYSMLRDWSRPTVDDVPAGSDADLWRKTRRGAIEAACQRNGTALFVLSQGRRDVFTDQVVRRRMPEEEFLVALRTQVGAPLSDVLHINPSPGEACSCHYHTGLQAGIDPHWFGCAHGTGWRNRRHSGLQRVMRFYFQKTGWALMDDRDITVPGLSQTAKIMDDILQDGDWKAFIDWTVTNPLGASVLKLVTQFKRGNQIALDNAIARKCKTYLAESRRHKASLVVFAVGHHGGFQSRSDKVIEGLDPKETLSNFYENPASLPVRGSIKLSVEEGLIHKTAHRGVNRSRGGTGAYDATLSQNSGAGMLINQIYRAIAYSCIRTTTQAIIRAVAQHNKFTGRFLGPVASD